MRKISRRHALSSDYAERKALAGQTGNEKHHQTLFDDMLMLK